MAIFVTKVTSVSIFAMAKVTIFLLLQWPLGSQSGKFTYVCLACCA
jgi:hypothetical protein